MAQDSESPSKEFEVPIGSLPAEKVEIPSIEISTDESVDLELHLSPERKKHINAAAVAKGPQSVPVDSTSMVDLGDDLLDKTAVISREALKNDRSPTPEVVSPATPAQPDLPVATLNISGASVRGLSSEDPAESFTAPVRDPDRAAVLDEPEPPEAAPAAGLSPDVGLSPKGDLEPNWAEIDEIWRRLASEFELQEMELSSSSQGQLQLRRSDAGEKTSVDDHIALGISFLEMGLFSQALSELERARAMDPLGCAAVVPLQVQALLKLGRTLEGLALIESVIGDPDYAPNDEARPHPLRAELLYWAARCCEELKRNGDALSWFRLLLESDPLHRDGEQRLRTIVMQLGQGGHA
jgi:hypothetical protein